MSENCGCNENTSCCCGPGEEFCDGDIPRWVTGGINFANGPVPVVSTRLTLWDWLGTCRVRCGIGRMNYRISPGLYAVGAPGGASPVLVSANYKLTFDSLRSELDGLDCWILILDTDGVNVWCSAGEGTFGTDELVDRLELTGLSEIVSHRTLILPQLGAPGVCAHEVKARSRFSVVYGPVRARDIKSFIDSGNVATADMRRVKFTMRDRLALTPAELLAAAKMSLRVFGVLFLLNLFASRQFGAADLAAYAGAVCAGAFVTPLLLPFVPGRAFSWKGWLVGLCWAAFIIWRNGWFTGSVFLISGYALLLPSLSAYLAMNFTGSSTYTSPSGVKREMKIALPLLLASSAIGSLLLLIQSLTVI